MEEQEQEQERRYEANERLIEMVEAIRQKKGRPMSEQLTLESAWNAFAAECQKITALEDQLHFLHDVWPDSALQSFLNTCDVYERAFNRESHLSTDAKGLRMAIFA